MIESKALWLINNTPSLQSLLYDVGMLPEQLQPGTIQWSRMLAYAYACQAGLGGCAPFTPQPEGRGFLEQNPMITDVPVIHA